MKQLFTYLFILCYLPIFAQCDIIIGHTLGHASWDMNAGSGFCNNYRTKILSPANFGPAGTVVVNSITIVDIPYISTITPAMLSGFDILFISWTEDVQLTATELADIQTWVDNGGVLVGFTDDNGHDAISAQFGSPVMDDNNNITPTALGSAHTIFNGSFGSVASVTTFLLRAAYTATPSSVILGVNPGGLPKVIEYVGGLGTAVFTADINTVANVANSGNMSPGAGVGPTEIFGMNLMEYLITRTTCTLLDVNLVYFNAENSGLNEALLSWQVAVEINNRHYEVQHASENPGGLNFTTLGYVTALNKPGSDYTYPVDYLADGTHYFRLKMTDQAGNESYSDIKSLNINGNSPTIQVYPSIINDNTPLHIISQYADEHVSIEVVSILGDGVKSLFNGAVQAGQVFEFDMKDVVAGQYILRIQGQKIQKSIKLIVQ